MARAVENATRPDSITDAFINTVFSGNLLGGLGGFSRRLPEWW